MVGISAFRTMASRLRPVAHAASAAPRRRRVPRDPAAAPLFDQRSGDRYVFDKDGRVPYELAATTICLRRSPNPENTLILESQLAVDDDGTFGGIALMMRDGQLNLTSGWQVLVGQSHVVNYLKSSTAGGVKLMRYPGEYLLPGGKAEPGEKLHETALRELEEEFLVKPPSNARTFPFRVRQTRMIGGKSNLMVNFVAIAEEQPSNWLADLDLDAINRELATKYAQAGGLLQSGDLDLMSHADREKLAPEVRVVEWRELGSLVREMQRSISAKLLPVNSWQAEQFLAHGIKRRSAVSVTMSTLVEVDLAGLAELLTLAAASGEARRARCEDQLLDDMVDRESYRFSSDVEMLCKPQVGRPKAKL